MPKSEERKGEEGEEERGEKKEREEEVEEEEEKEEGEASMDVSCSPLLAWGWGAVCLKLSVPTSASLFSVDDLALYLKNGSHKAPTPQLVASTFKQHSPFLLSF